MREGEALGLVESVTFACPGCDRPCTVGTGTDDRPTVLHPLPTCERFDAIEDSEGLIELMRDARRKALPHSFS